MRVEDWDPDRCDEQFEDIARERLIEAANVVADWARVKCPVGTIKRSVYTRGKYAGLRWTEREPGTLRRSIRVVYKKTKTGKVLRRKRTNVRIYAGHYLAFYALFVEFGAPQAPAQPFLRPAFYASIPQIKSILGAR